MSTEYPSYDAFDSDPHRQWKADRQLRWRVPLHEAWRGCLGLAVLLDRADDTEAHGDLALVRNDRVTWLALRDVPVGRCPGSPVMNRREVNYANRAVAELRYGVPAIDFTRDVRDAVDFRFMPVGQHLRRVGPHPWDVRVAGPLPDTLDSDHRSREFAVLNAVSAAMTQFAFCATGDRGPLRPAWAARRPTGTASHRPAPPAAWMPRPYLAFPVATAGRMYDLAGGPAGLRRSAPAVRERLRRAAARGLQVRAVGPEVYCGRVRNPGGWVDRGTSSAGVAHRLRGLLDGRERVVTLPPTARVGVAAGTPLEAGEPWARVPAAAAADDDDRRDPTGGDVRRVVREIGRPWFEGQAARPADDPGVVLFPADLVAHAARDLRPVGLWWDTAPALGHYRWEFEAAVFPPLAIRRWDRLRLALPGEVALDATIVDPRFMRADRDRRPSSAAARPGRRRPTRAVPARAPAAVRDRAA